LFLSFPALTASADHSLTHAGLYGCDRVIRHDKAGDLEKATDPPDGSTVQPGQTIHVRITWDAEDWNRRVLHKVIDCVTVDGVLDEGLSAGQKPTANDGVFEHDYTVPEDAAPGTEVCDRAMLTAPDRGEHRRGGDGDNGDGDNGDGDNGDGDNGDNGDGDNGDNGDGDNGDNGDGDNGDNGDFRQDVSNLVCFTVAPPPPPPAVEITPIREVKEERPAPTVLPAVEVRPETLPRSGMEDNVLLGLAAACLGLAYAGRRLRAAAGR
jgi:hypothetical protein